MRTEAMRLSDGRLLEFGLTGPRDGRPVIVFHGWAETHHMRHPDDSAASRLGVLIVTVSRPGLGRSDPDPGRTLLDWPSDVAELADHLDLGPFAIVGRSAGGAFAAACAYSLAERLTTATIVSGIGPLDGDGAGLVAGSEFWPLMFIRRVAPEL